MDSESPIVQKLSFSFRKLGRARFYSHHDLMRAFERGLRRAGINPLFTQGFNPKPRMVFPSALGLGIESECEELEVELGESRDPAGARQALAEALSPMLDVTGVTVLPPKKKGRAIKSCTYALSGFSANLADLESAVCDMLAADVIMTYRGHGEKRREIDFRPFIIDCSVSADDAKLILKLSHAQEGAGRPDEIAAYISASTGGAADLIVIRKTSVEWR